MPVLSRRTRHLLRLLFGLGHESKLGTLLNLLPFLIWAVLIVWYLVSNDGQYSGYAFAIVASLYVELNFRTLASDNKLLRERTRKMMSMLHGIDLMHRNMRGRGGVLVDVNDFVNKAKEFSQNQAAHREQRR